ncbi:MAG: YihA family ribosome biogenesis GTP-binding protein [Barnesiella sp.]|nr:YihA family ribosome biogenesis GTP-binding protein [Barnesiella sp.]MBD5254063.1 YihA family ribosome biogenesis GTP-binding protein [Barnesiella sp.]MBD5343905.1 YihA family ribosome biogenesis GTP-binding protein [Bacteroides sp.]
MIINSARFSVSSPKVEKCPPSDLHEFAFIGRSNVGKSSLINMLTGHSRLAKTSATPGKTLLINHFLINDSWYIVDLPGYGYARRGQEQRDALQKMIEGYILHREQMTCLFLLIDSRHEPMKIDMDFMNWLGENGVPFALVFTKLDKQSKSAGNRNVKLYIDKILETWEELPPVFMTSSADGRGREELLDYIEQLSKLPVGYSDDDTAAGDTQNPAEE